MRQTIEIELEGEEARRVLNGEPFPLHFADGRTVNLRFSIKGAPIESGVKKPDIPIAEAPGKDPPDAEIPKSPKRPKRPRLRAKTRKQRGKKKSPKRGFKCRYCPRRLKSKQAKSTHETRSHKKEKLAEGDRAKGRESYFECAYCGQGLPTSDEREAHEKKEHPKEWAEDNADG